MSRAWKLCRAAALVAGFLLCVQSASAGADPLIVSRTSSGAAANKASLYPSVAEHGRFVAFSSLASDLVANDTNNAFDIFVWDAADGTIARVSMGLGGQQANGNSYWPSISADGRFIAFYSQASNLVGGDNNGRWDVFIVDRLLQSTARVSRNANGHAPNGDSLNPAMSPDGRFVVYASSASDIVEEDRNSSFDVFLFDRHTGTTEKISTPSGQGDSNGASDWPSVSADGRYVAFQSTASNLSSADTNNQIDIFVADRHASTLLNLTRGGNGPSYWPSISGDGSVVAFSSAAANLVSGDLNNAYDIFAFSMTDARLHLVSQASGGGFANSHSYWPRVDTRGRSIAYTTLASDISTQDSNSTWDVYVYDVRSGGNTLISGLAGGAGNNVSYWPALSPDGRYVGFASMVSNFSPPDNNNTWDIFIADRGPLNQPPVADAGADLSLECEGSTTAVVLDGSASYDPDGDTLRYTWRGPFGTLAGTERPTVFLPYGDNAVGLTVEDPAGESASDALTVTIRDATAPTLTVPGLLIAEATSVAGAQVDLVPVTEDACGAVGVYLEPTPEYYPIGDTLVTVTATDEHQNRTQATTTVSVRDTIAPRFEPAAAILAEATGPLTALELPAPIANDAVGVVLLYRDGPSQFALGTTVVTWYAEDAAGNQGATEQHVSIVDTTPPTMTPPPAIEMLATGVLSDVLLGDATAFDLVDGSVMATPATLGPFAVGEHTVSWRAQDASGNEVVALQSVTILNNAPSVSPLDDRVASEGEALSFQIDINDVDSLSWNVTIDFGDGNAARMSLDSPTMSVSVEHVYGNEGSYTATVEVADDHAGLSQTSFAVSVSNVAPRITSFDRSEDQISVGDVLAVTAQVTDPGIGEQLSWSFDWGDGAVDHGELATTDARLSLSHRYDAPGLFAITLTVGDGLSVASQTTEVVVVNEGQYIAVGGGRFGAWNKGSRHQRDEFAGRVGIRLAGPAVAPRGLLTLYWRDATGTRWKLKAREHDWMVITDDALYLRGRGSVNGNTPVDYALTIEGERDAGQRIRWRVWHGESGELLAESADRVLPPGHFQWRPFRVPQPHAKNSKREPKATSKAKRR